MVIDWFEESITYFTTKIGILTPYLTALDFLHFLVNLISFLVWNFENVVRFKLTIFRLKSRQKYQVQTKIKIKLNHNLIFFSSLIFFQILNLNSKSQFGKMKTLSIIDIIIEAGIMSKESVHYSSFHLHMSQKSWNVTIFKLLRLN